MSRFLNEKFQTLEPYTPGEQPKVLGKLIKLNTNENPYEPAPSVVKVINEAEVNRLKLYSEPAASQFTDAVAELQGTARMRYSHSYSWRSRAGPAGYTILR